MKAAAQRLEKLEGNFFATLGPRIAALEAAGCDVIRLDIGSPDLPPAPPILEALSRTAASVHAHGYQPHNGTRALREAWASLYRRAFGVELDPETEVVPLLGSKEGIFHLIQACAEPGDIVLVPDPGYMTYARGALFAGGQPFAMPLLPERDYLPDLDAIPKEIAGRAKMMWLNYPNNPTAALASRDFFEQAVAFAQFNNLLLCHDAAYSQITFDGSQALSLLEIPGARDVSVEFNTLSKSHNMAGWRVGTALGNPSALSRLYALKTNLDSGHFLPILEAATAAMTGDQAWLQARNEVYRERRDLVVAGLHRLGLNARVPQGSIYVWSPVPPGWSSVEFAAALLDCAHVSLTPGTVFGAQGEGYVRIALTAPAERVAEAMERIQERWPCVS